MIAEAQIGGVLLAPIAVYGLVAIVLFLLCRVLLGRAGVLRHVWHPALFEVSLFVILLSLLVQFL